MSVSPKNRKIDARSKFKLVRHIAWSLPWVLGLMLTACGASPTSNTSPLADSTGTNLKSRKLLTWKEIASHFKGTFVIPQAQEKGNDFRFGFSDGIHVQLANGNLIVNGHPSFDRQAEIQMPATLNGAEAIRVGAWKDITEGLLPSGWSGGESYILGGMVERGDKLWFTKHQWYNGGGTDWASQGFVQNGKANGMWKVNAVGAHSQRVGGYMGIPPEALMAQGITYMAGQQGTSGAATSRWGPNLFAIEANPSLSTQLGFKGTAMMLFESESKAMPGWWIGDWVTGYAWIETPTHHAVIFFLHQQLGGKTWYGEASENGGSPYGGDKGFHAAGYVLKAWIFNPEHLLEVYAKKRPAWNVRPTEEVVFIERQPGSAKETVHSMITGRAKQNLQASFRNGKLILLQPGEYRPDPYEGTPKGYVFDFN